MATERKWEDPTERENPERWHGDLLALDPGVRSPGIALFRHGVLTACARIRVPDEIHELHEPERWLRVADLCVEWWLGTWNGITRTVRTFVYERPQWYSEREKKSKGDPNKLAHVLGVGQTLATMLAMRNNHIGARQPEMLAPLPAEWTGQIPKTDRSGKLPKDPRKSPRHARVWSCLEPGEKSICLRRLDETNALTDELLAHVNNDAFDGIGLGLSALGRYKPGTTGRVFAGATR